MSNLLGHKSGLSALLLPQAHAEWDAASRSSTASARREALVAGFANASAASPHAFALSRLASAEDRNSLETLAYEASTQKLATNRTSNISLVRASEPAISPLRFRCGPRRLPIHNAHAGARAGLTVFQARWVGNARACN